MAPPIALAAAGRELRRLAGEAARRRGGEAASPTMQERIERIAELAEAAEPTARALSLGEVTDALFAGTRNPVEQFRELRRKLRTLARECGLDLTCEVDGHKHAPASARRCWFTGTDDSVRELERLSAAQTAQADGVVEVRARARRAVRVCVDGLAGRHAADLTQRLREVLGNDRELLDVEVSDTQPLAGESPGEVRAQRLARADVAVCLLSNAYLSTHRRAELGDLVVVPVALELLGDGADLRGFASPCRSTARPSPSAGERASSSPSCATRSPPASRATARSSSAW